MWIKKKNDGQDRSNQVTAKSFNKTEMSVLGHNGAREALSNPSSLLLWSDAKRSSLSQCNAACAEDTQKWWQKSRLCIDCVCMYAYVCMCGGLIPAGCLSVWAGAGLAVVMATSAGVSKVARSTLIALRTFCVVLAALWGRRAHCSFFPMISSQLRNPGHILYGPWSRRTCV